MTALPPSTSSEADLEKLGAIDVKFFGKPRATGRVVWTAPDGIDLALVRVPFKDAGEAQSALWQKGRPTTVGSQVFAIGNPHRLGWTHTQGVISQLRPQQAGNRQIRLIQVQVALNPGNSGGGLYDREGFLIGINSLSQDKSVSEGIGFAITLDTAARPSLRPTSPRSFRWIPRNAPKNPPTQRRMNNRSRRARQSTSAGGRKASSGRHAPASP